MPVEFRFRLFNDYYRIRSVRQKLKKKTGKPTPPIALKDLPAPYKIKEQTDEYECADMGGGDLSCARGVSCGAARLSPLGLFHGVSSCRNNQLR